jgi:hypothetical protein
MLKYSELQLVLGNENQFWTRYKPVPFSELTTDPLERMPNLQQIMKF